MAALTPLSVDGMIVAASTTLLADSWSGLRGGALPWILLVIGSGASLAANVAVAEPTVMGNWLRAAAWAGAWIAGVALLAQAGAWGIYPEQICPNSYQNSMVCPIPSPAVVSWGELSICAAWLVLGAVMTWILAVPACRSDVPTTSSRASGKASRRPASARDLRT